MRKIINRKAYDTNTAEELGIWSNGYSPRDFVYTEETLFRKKTGEYFLYGFGGPRSKYAKRIADGYTGGEMIIPMTQEEAELWAEEHLTTDEYETIFGEVEE